MNCVCGDDSGRNATGSENTQFRRMLARRDASKCGNIASRFRFAGLLGMVRKSLALALAISGVGYAAAASAQTFSGGHVGISAGGAVGAQSQAGGLLFLPGTGSSSSVSTTTTTIITITTTTTAPADGSYGIGGPMLGASVGYDWQFDRVVLGLQSDISWASVRGSGSCGWGSVLPHKCGGGITWLGTTRARLGFALGNGVGPFGRLLPYITGGLAYGGVRGWDSLFGGSGSKTSVGWTLGAGIEALIAPNWSVKLEYLHVDLGKRGVFTAIPPNVERVRTTAEVIRLGLNYRFNAYAPAPVSAKY